MSTTVNMKLKLKTSGLQEANKETKEISNNLKEAAVAAAKVSKGTSGSRAASSSTSAKSAAAASAAREENKGYNTQRAIGPGTGSASSDFARQASGLGGLVHVYATFAANLFAASAAFNMLSKAMDTSNLVKGLDQIGAATGRNLGSVAKQMVAAADGAISLRDAMSSTAMASSAGMTNDAIIRMTKVAQKASLALGRDMSDSMERLTKGIAKIQPELLDELGIMTRVIPAQQEYARQIGKTAATLTDFEKRQAFANAVLAEGERKFGSINLDSNPYSKLLASITNLTTAGLDLVNKVASPLINMLSASPTGLAVAMAGIASVLLKQAIPAINNFRANAKTAAEEARSLAVDRSKAASDFGTGSQKKAALNSAKIEFDRIKQVQAAEKLAFDDIASTREDIAEKSSKRIEKMQFSYGKATMETLAKSSTLITDKQISALKSQATRLFNKGAVAESDFLKESIVNIEKSRAAHADYDAAVIRSEQITASAAKQKMLVDQETAKITASRFSVEKQLRDDADKANRKAQSAEISSNVATIARQKGMVEAYKNLNAEITKARSGPTINTDDSITPKMSAMGAGITRIKGLAGLATTALDIFSGAIQRLAMWVGTAVLVFNILDGIFGTSAKQSEEYTTSIDTLNSSLDNVSRTLDVINNKSSAEFLSVESTQAKATALDDLSGSISGAISKFNKLQEAQSSWDSFFDGLWDFVGKGSGDKLAIGISSSVISSFKLLEDGPAKEQAKKSIQAIVGQKADFSSVSAFNKSIKDLDKSSISSIGASISKILQDTSREANNAAASLTTFKTSLTDINKQGTIMSNALIPTDDFSKLGTLLGTSAKNLNDVLKDPIHSLQALREIAGDMRTLSLLPPDLAINIGRQKEELDKLSESLASLKKQASIDIAIVGKSNSKGYSNLASAREVKTLDVTGNEASRENLVGKEIAAAKVRLEANKAEQDTLSQKLEKIQSDVKSASISLAEASYTNLAKGLNKALAEASITSAKGYLDIIKQAGGSTASLDASLNKASIDIQISQVQALYTNSQNMVKLTLALEAASLETKKLSIETSLVANPNRDNWQLRDNLDTLNKELDKNTAAREVLDGGDSAMLAAKKLGDSELLNKLGNLPTEIFGKMQQLAGLFAQKGNASLQEQAGTITDAASNERKVREDSNTGLNSRLAELDNLQKINGVYSSVLQQEKQVTESALLRNKYLQQQEDISNNIKIADIAIVELSKKKVRNSREAHILSTAEELKISQTTSLEKSKANQVKDTAVASSKALSEQLAGEASIRKIIRDTASQEFKDLNSITLAKNTNNEQTIAYQKLIGGITEEDYLSKKKSIDLDNLSISNLQTMAELDRSRADSIDIYNDQKELKLAINPEADTSFQDSQIAKVKQSYDRQVSAQNILSSGKKLQIELESTHSQLLSKQTDQMNTLVDITGSLAAVFGEVGENIGKAGEAMLLLSHNSELRAKSEEGKSGTDLEKIRKKNTQAELKDISTVAAAMKKSIGEKTVAGKAAAAIERGASLEKLSLQAKEQVFTEDNMKKAKEGINTFMSAVKDGTVVDGIAAVVKQGIGGDPWTAIPRMISMASFISSLTGESISGPPPIDQGTMAGTGQQVAADGQTIGTRAGGVLGDPKAQAKSISDSIEGLSHIFFGTMGSSSSSLLKHLKGIQDNTYNTAKALGAAGTIGSGNPFGAAFGDSKAFSTGVGLLDNLLGGIFGGNTSQTLTGSGIRGSGTATGLAGNAGSIQGYTNIHTETSGGWFSSGSSSDRTVMSKLDNAITKGLQGIFTNFNNVLLDTAKGLGKNREDIKNILDTTAINLNVSNAGLTGTEFAQKLSAEVSVQLNMIAEKAYPFLNLYTKVGEESFQTATRLIKDSETVTFGLNMVGTSINSLLSVQDKIIEQQKVIDNFGGSADAYASAIQAYYDALFTDSEKAITSFSNVSMQLAELGIAGVTTKVQLRNLISTLDPTSELYASLVLLVPAFSDMVGALDKMKESFEGLQTTAYDLIATTISSTQDAAKAATASSLELKRAATLSSIDPTLKSMQKYVFALEDLKTAEAELASIRKKNLSITKKTSDDQISVIKTTISTMSSFITSLESFKDSLLLGAQSILNPGDKYTEASKQFSDILATATSSAITPEQQKLKDAALNQIQSSATAFLDASRVYNASSTQYTLDFNAVQDALSSTAGTLKLQKSTAEVTLDELTIQSTLMQSQLDALDSVTNAIQDTTSAVEIVSLAVEKVALALELANADKAAADAKIAKVNLDSQVAAAQITNNALASAVTAGVAASISPTGQNTTAATTARTDALNALIAEQDNINRISQSGGDTQGRLPATGWDTMTNAEKASYFSANPTMAKLDQVIQGVFYDFTTLGTIIGYLNPVAKELSMSLSRPDAVDFGPGVQFSYSQIEAMKSINAEVTATKAAEALAVEVADVLSTLSASYNYTVESSGSGPSAVDSGGYFGGGYTGDGFAGLDSSGYDSPFAKGGLASKGAHLVGELGPELVDFSTPGRVYTAQETFGMFNGVNSSNSLVSTVNELKALRKEIQQLREQQRTETGHLINATYDSQNQNAQVVTEAVVTTAANQAWSNRVHANAQVA